MSSSFLDDPEVKAAGERLKHELRAALSAVMMDDALIEHYDIVRCEDGRTTVIYITLPGGREKIISLCVGECVHIRDDVA